MDEKQFDDAIDGSVAGTMASTFVFVSAALVFGRDIGFGLDAAAIFIDIVVIFLLGGWMVGTMLGLASAFAGELLSRFTRRWELAVLCTPPTIVTMLLLPISGRIDIGTAVAYLLIAASSGAGAYFLPRYRANKNR